MQTGYNALLADGGTSQSTAWRYTARPPLRRCQRLIYSVHLGQQIAGPLQHGEKLIGPAQGLLALFNLPRLVKKILAFFTRSTDPFASRLYKNMHPQTLLENRNVIAERDEYRARWHEKWLSEGLDFVLTVPHPLPAIEHGASEKATLMSVGYTFLFSMVSSIDLFLCWRVILTFSFF